MPLRKNKTVKDKLQSRLEDLLAQADDVRQQLVDHAPEVRDSVVAKTQSGAADVRDIVAAKASHGVAELRERLPELRDELLERTPELNEKTYDKLPKRVADRLPDEVKPKKKRRLRRIVGLGLIAGAASAVGLDAPRRRPHRRLARRGRRTRLQVAAAARSRRAGTMVVPARRSRAGWPCPFH
ncbi:MAG: hypothetical protein EON53_08640 [Actinomycetales bacterium]|nr:MAG: hypothetical protein EON53_08640 [Actinomycetales bacterium]